MEEGIQNRSMGNGNWVKKERRWGTEEKEKVEKEGQRRDEG